MKRFAFLLLAMLLMLPLASCGSKNVPPEETKAVESREELADLPAEERYRAAVKKTENLHAVTYESTLDFEGEKKTVKSLRVRRGYDDFDYERKGEESLSITDGKIYVSHPLGKFSAQVSLRGAREYLAQYWYPLTGLSADDLSDFGGEGLTVTYKIASPQILKLYADAASDPAFLPEQGVGEVTLSADGVIEKEKITVTGKGEGGKKCTLLVESILTDGDSALTVTAPSGRFTPVGDIRIPHIFTSSVAALEESESLSATMMTSRSMKQWDVAASQASVLHYFQTSPHTFYLSEEKVSQTKGEQQTKTFSQILQKDGVRTTLEFDRLTGDVLEEGEKESYDTVLSSLFAQYRMDLSLLSDFSLTEDNESITVSFSFSAEGESEIYEILRALAPNPASSSFSAPTVREGVFTVSKKTGRLTVFSAMLSGADFSYSCSMTLDEEQSVTLPPWQTPAPENGNENPEEGEHKD